ncbi:MAG: DUF5119 domain-containing protein [Bacteroidales bacterium]|nr:DUF5119 domain-containing protein [Bacteroidales bacterium]
MRNWTVITAAFAMAATLASCEKECLCHVNGNGKGKARVGVEVDWSGFDKEQPTGMTLIASDGSTVSTHDLTLGEIALPVGVWDVSVINQSPDEFGGLAFDGLTVKAVTTPASSWTGLSAVAVEPEWLAYGVAKEITVESGMLASWCKCTDCCCVSTHTAQLWTLAAVSPTNVISTLNVTVKVGGIENLSSVRAVSEGLAAWLDLESGDCGGSSAMMLSSWDIDKTAGEITATTRCLGLGDQPLAVTVQFLLRDQTTIITKTFTDILVTTDGLDHYVYLELDENLPFVEPTSGTGGGFSAEVEDWGEANEIPI